MYRTISQEERRRQLAYSGVAFKAIVFVFLCGFLSLRASAQYPTLPQQPSGPVQIISNTQYNQMLQQRELKETGPLVWLEQYIERLFQDLKNQAVVDQFVQNNPDVPGIAQLVKPATSQSAQRTPEGNYLTTITLANGTTQTIELLGQSTKLGQLANTITSAADPVKKLALYQAAYTQYSATFAQYCSQSTYGPPPGSVDIPNPVTTDNEQIPCASLISPASLADPALLGSASLDQINTALRTIGSYGRLVLHILPITVGPPPVACSQEVGVGDAPSVNGTGYFGDQVNSVGYTPSATGLYANFNFPSKKNLTCIKNQGHRGMCHIFAAISSIEYLIARDTGAHVNLSEQDFIQRSKAIWKPDYFNDGGDSLDDLNAAQQHNYNFAFENAWDYNPSLSQALPPGPEYKNSCLNYPYPVFESGCSETAPQSPGVCAIQPTFFGLSIYQCSLSPVFLTKYSPYSSAGGTSIWDLNNEDLSIDQIILALAFNNAVILGFDATDNFNNTPDGFVAYHPAALDNSIGAHAVQIVGYVSNEDLAANPVTAFHEPALGGGYFIVKNSWGTGSGDAGFLYLPVDYLKSHASAVYVVSSFNQ